MGAALLSATLAATLINAWAHRFVHELPSDDQDGPRGPRLRREVFGAILAWAGVQLHVSPAWAQVALDAGVPEVGADAAVVDGALRAPTEVHLSVTERCPVRCTGCYLSAGPDAAEPDLRALYDTIDQLSEMGVFEVAFGGGEALLRPELVRLARYARQRGLTPNLTTSGFGLTPALAATLAPLVGQINISMDGLGATYAASRGWDGTRRGLSAIRTLAAAGIRVGVNTVLSRPLLETPGALDALGQAIADAGAAEWQWLRFKPAGRGAAQWDQLAPSSAQLSQLWKHALRLEAETGLTLRYDCALTPFLANAGIPLDRLERLGVAGCIGGESLWSRSAAGHWAPCSFAAGQPADADLATAWATDDALQAWRDRAAAPPEPCGSCSARHICRGGCRIVSAHLTGDPMAPDPQCPKVIAWKA